MPLQQPIFSPCPKRKTEEISGIMASAVSFPAVWMITVVNRDLENLGDRL